MHYTTSIANVWVVFKMPRTTERKRVLEMLEQTTSALQLKMAVQIILSSSSELLDTEDGGVEDDAEEETGENIQLFVSQLIASLRRTQDQVLKSRYYCERQVWRGLIRTREGEMEKFFSMISLGSGSK